MRFLEEKEFPTHREFPASEKYGNFGGRKIGFEGGNCFGKTCLALPGSWKLSCRFLCLV